MAAEAGIDERNMEASLDYIETHWEELESQLLAGAYRPPAVLRIEIKKPGGGTRKLGVPTIVDRVLQ